MAIVSQKNNALNIPFYKLRLYYEPSEIELLEFVWFGWKHKDSYHTCLANDALYLLHLSWNFKSTKTEVSLKWLAGRCVQIYLDIACLLICILISKTENNMYDLRDGIMCIMSQMYWESWLIRSESFSWVCQLFGSRNAEATSESRVLKAKGTLEKLYLFSIRYK